MTLHRFIIEHLEEILVEWESFARTLLPAAASMDSPALRDHAREMLVAIAADMETAQSEEQQAAKSQGRSAVFHGERTAAATHGLVRHTSGFGLLQMIAEFRALRATVLRLWGRQEQDGNPADLEEVTRFNEAVDQTLAESVAAYWKELSTSRDTFLAVLGYDLRTPLNALSGSLRLLSQGGDAAGRAEALAKGARSVSAMDAMIGDLLEYTRTRLGGTIPIAPVQANLETICKTAVNDVAQAFAQTAFRFESSGRLDGVFDAARMLQVVSNLLSYAACHGKRGVPVFLMAYGTNDSLGFEVRTQGNPLSPAALQAIFEPSTPSSLEGPDQRGAANPGLGLFVAREIVRAHDGKIHASSSADTGTTFTVELSRARRSEVSMNARGNAV